MLAFIFNKNQIQNPRKVNIIANIDLGYIRLNRYNLICHFLLDFASIPEVEMPLPMFFGISEFKFSIISFVKVFFHYVFACLDVLIMTIKNHSETLQANSFSMNLIPTLNSALQKNIENDMSTSEMLGKSRKK